MHKHRKKKKDNRPLIFGIVAIALVILLPLVLLVTCNAAQKKDADSSSSQRPAQSGSGSVPVQSVLPPASSASLPVASISSQPPPASSESVSSEEPQPQPAPVFAEAPAVSLSGKTASVTFKTDVESTINAVVTTQGGAVGTAAFYNYFNRGQALDGAVAKKSTYMVTAAGKTESYELPDLNQSYWLLVNAVENATGTWQGGVLVVPLYSPAESATAFTGAPARGQDTATHIVFGLQTHAAANIYVLVTPKNAPAPTAQQVRDGGAGYTGVTLYGTYTLPTTTAAPFTATLQIPKTNLAAGEYVVWCTAQNAQHTGAPLAAVVQAGFTV